VTSPSWVTHNSEIGVEWKRAIARYAATHMIGYGDVLQLASGTTLNFLMEEIVETQANQHTLDLIILTSNLQVLAKGRDTLYRNPSAFGNTQIILTGGMLSFALDSLVGEYAANGVRLDIVYPRTVFFGATRLTFREGLTLTYQFQDQISTQLAYATRPTDHRVILCDHAKFGKKTGFRAEINIRSLLENCSQCSVISTLPDEEVALRVVEQEEESLRWLLEPMIDDPQFEIRISSWPWSTVPPA
jgi:DeoR/GlpR family transcriptional regulator of sugar metabolism